MAYTRDDHYFGMDGASLALDSAAPSTPARGRGEVLELKRSPDGLAPPSIRATALVFNDPRSQALEERIQRFAQSDASVLIVGQTGTGKELVARHVHACSRRASGPFVAINCAALPESLADAELFGHERGAFTGANEARAGYFETAHRGTLFLDEIGDLSLPMQIKLLRVLQERSVVRLGARAPRQLDVRIVAATNVDLERAVAAGRFREDLYFRLNVARLDVLPLSKRPGDIDPLVEHFLQLYVQRSNLPPTRLSKAARQRLHLYGWPGNIRELENAIHHGVLLARDGVIEAEDLMLAGTSHQGEDTSTPGAQLENALGQLLNASSSASDSGGDGGTEGVFAQVLHQLVSLAMQRTGNNQVQAAKLLGISRNTLRTQLSHFGYL
ncbi:sigma-54 interaction domain-containing protein [Carnimonas bestiolae]|uniref:sigma-54 interaction domain-containing protein n=1 Tax=Carnimonas bestiolae TaxID=3402172 RepID=UPI003EDC864D